MDSSKIDDVVNSNFNRLKTSNFFSEIVNRLLDNKDLRASDIIEAMNTVYAVGFGDCARFLRK